jgi:hypothetical protein
MTNDRHYYRMLKDRDLTIIASERFTTDLELVLLERLESLIDVEDQLDAAQAEILELTASRDHWQAEANTLQAQLEAK